MICKGGTRSYPTSLAQHLTKTDNERVVIVELKHTATQDLKEALNDMHATIAMTSGKKSLYHAQINPAPREIMTPKRWQYAVDEMERRLGFEGQPRAVVFHEKKGREHLHVVWQRTDVEKGKIITNGNDYYIHKELGKHLEKEFRHKPLKREFDNNWETMNERQQTIRDGYSPKQLKARIKMLYKKHQDPLAFKNALKKAKFDLAIGKRGVVMVSDKGEIHSLMRYTNEKKRTIENRLKPILANLPNATDLAKSKAQEKTVSKKKEHNTIKRPKTFVENAFDILSRDEIGKSSAKFDKIKKEFKEKEWARKKSEFTDNDDDMTQSKSIDEAFKKLQKEQERQEQEKQNKERGLER